MANEPTMQDELDRRQLDQLHAVVLQFSRNCFEIKKLCLTILVSASVFIVSMTAKQLNAWLFIGAAVVILFFYFLDVQSYFYQEKLRIVMKRIAESMITRHTQQIEIDGAGVLLTPERLAIHRLRHASFNSSMWFYGCLILLDLVGFLLYFAGVLVFPGQR